MGLEREAEIEAERLAREEKKELDRLVREERAKQREEKWQSYKCLRKKR